MSVSTLSFTTTITDRGMRLDLFLSKQLPHISRSRLQSWIRAQGDKPARLLQKEETIQLLVPETQANSLTPQNLPLEVLYEDPDLLVINKTAGLVVHPAAGNPDNTLVNALLFHFPYICVGDTQRPGIVHRLDKNTSGLMIVAKNSHSHELLSQAFKKHDIRKIYRALCMGILKQKEFTLKTGHQRHPTHRKRFTTKYPTQKIAHSHFQVLSEKNNISELRIEIFTGRTHQIRAQLADLGHPILGDILYGAPPIKGISRQALHAEELYFNHPISNQPLHFVCPARFYEFQNLP